MEQLGGSALKKLFACALILMATVIVSSQRGGLGSFSPQTLRVRTQSERTIFGFGVPIYRSFYEYNENPLITMLVKDGYIAPLVGTSEKWITVYHWNESWRDGDGAMYDV